MKHLIEDTRNKTGQHEEKHQYWRQIGCRVIRCCLPFGDYCTVPPIAVDTKQDIYEIAGNIDHDHGRFRNELIRARDHGCQLVILVENTDGVYTLDDLERWRESDSHFYARDGKQRISGRRLARAMRTMAERYGVRWEFCTPNEAGRRVIEILGGEQ